MTGAWRGVAAGALAGALLALVVLLLRGGRTAGVPDQVRAASDRVGSADLGPARDAVATGVDKVVTKAREVAESAQASDYPAAARNLVASAVDKAKDVAPAGH